LLEFAPATEAHMSRPRFNNLSPNNVHVLSLLRLAVAAKIVRPKIQAVLCAALMVGRNGFVFAFHALMVKMYTVLAPHHDHSINGGSVSNFVKRKKVFIGYSKLVFQ
jgi:hypothetical protein